MQLTGAYKKYVVHPFVFEVMFEMSLVMKC